MKLELYQIASYLPYNLKVQYEGIVNGKELGEQERKNKDLAVLDADWSVQPIHGLKTGTVKEVSVFKNYWRMYAGNNGRAMKCFTNGHDFKPLVRAMSDFNGSDADTEIFETGKYYTSVKLNEASELPQWEFNILCKYGRELRRISSKNRAVFDLLEMTGDKQYSAETMIKAAKLLSEMCGEWTPDYKIMPL